MKDDCAEGARMKDEGMINIGFLGYGYWGPNVLRSLHRHPKARVLSACDPDPDNAARLAQTYPDVRVHSEYRPLFEDPRIDAVVIATPADTHFPLSWQALLWGKHVFVEKPMAVRSEEAGALADFAEEQNRLLMVGHIFEYNHAVNKIRQILGEGLLGKVHYVIANRTSLGPRVRNDVNVVWDYAIHDIYISTYLFGSGPEKVRARGISCLQAGIEDTVFIDLYFPESVWVSIHCSWYEPIKQRNMTIVGSERMLVYNETTQGPEVSLYRRGFAPASGHDAFGNRGLRLFDDGQETVAVRNHPEPLDVELDHFLECILSGERPRSDGHDGRRTLEVIEAVNASLRNGGQEAHIERRISNPECRTKSKEI